jgi:hypothetical protein
MPIWLTKNDFSALDPGYVVAGPLIATDAGKDLARYSKKYKNKNLATPRWLKVPGGKVRSVGLGFPEIRKKHRLVDCSDVHDQRDESRQRKRDREESDRGYGYHDHSSPLFEPGDFPASMGASVPTGRPWPM